MGNTKHRKNHKQKLASRKQKATESKNTMVKAQRNMIMQFIEQEKQKGLFDNTTPLTDGPIIEGPSI